MQNKRPYNTVNTFSRRPCINQIISYIIIASDNLTFWIIIQPNYVSQICRFTMIAFFTCSSILLLIFGCITSTYDPSDPIMTQYRNGNTNILQSTNQLCLFCDHCQAYVFTTSRHCKLCDRCVDKFDHHCIWINNCIGKSNYKVFIAMILTAEAHLIIYLISVGLLWQENNWKSFIVSMILNWVVFAAVLIFSFLLLGLIILHLYLISNSLTTYEYIVAKRNTQIIPKTQLQIQSNTQFQTSSNEINPKDKSIDENSDCAHKTGNMFPPVSAFSSFQRDDGKLQGFKTMNPLGESQLNAIQQQDKGKAVSQFEDIKSINQQQKQRQNFDDFYKTHHGLKFLLGNGVTVKSKKSNSCKQIKTYQNHQNSVSVTSEEKEINQLAKVKEKFANVNVIFEQ